jgi:hypothetical protein
MSVTSIVNDTIGRDSFVNSQKPVPPTITGYSVSGLDDTALDPAGGQTVFIDGTGFQRGAIVTFDGSAIAVVSFVSSSRLSFTSPAKSAGTYTIYVVNSDGGTAIFIPGIIYSTLPTWTTAAGSLGSYFETTSISNTVSASGDVPITYSLFSGELPPGSTLNANGVLSGTSPVDSGSTTYSFTIEAIDNQLQGSTRSFSLTINTDVVSWVSPTQGQTLTFPVNSAISNVALNATSAAGYNVSYLANSLPTGLSLTGNTISGTPTVIANTSTLLTATAATTNRSATNTITWAVLVAGDPQFMYVTTLLSPQISVVPFNDDASTNNFVVSVVGDTRPNNFSPYTPGYYSNFFDGSGDFLTVGSNANLALGSADWTVESWIYPTSVAIAQNIIIDWRNSNSGLPVLYMVNNQVWWRESSATKITSSVTLNANTWYHVAVVKASTTTTMYINGVSVGSYTDTTNYQNADLKIGKAWDSNHWNGYISNLRIVKGTALYTANFTPPTAPLTAIANTSLLTCQSNRFIDNSTNNFAITRSGDVRIDGFDPFVVPQELLGRGSTYFNNTYLEAISSGNLLSSTFTIQFWLYVPVVPTTTRYILSFSNSDNTVSSLYFNMPVAGTIRIVGSTGTYSSSNNQVGKWTHVAATKTPTTLKLYIDGILQGTGEADTADYSSQSRIKIGTSLNGTTGVLGQYISNLQIVNSELYTTNFTPPTEPLTAIAGTSLLTCQTSQPHNNNQFLDSSTNNFLVTRNGNTTQGTFSPYGGGWSNYFDGVGDGLTVASNNILNFGTGDFTVEFWMHLNGYSSTTPGNIIHGGSNGNFAIYFVNNGVQIARYNQGGDLTYSGTPPLNVWAHWAFTRFGTTGYIFLNGTQVATGTVTTNYGASSFNLGTGSALYYSNVRVVKGTAVYTANFTPPIAPLQPIAGTSLLTCADNRFVDDSPNNFTITRNGDVSVQKFNPFGIQTAMTPQTHSAYFDGSGDRLTINNNGAFDFGTGDFTIEAWVNPQSFGNVGLVFFSNFIPNSFRFVAYLSATGVGVDSGGQMTFSGTTTCSVGTWYHCAVVRSGSSFKTYINGILNSTATYSNSYWVTTGTSVTVGDYSDDYSTALGIISNVRVVKGTAVYTSNFTPPTAPLTAIANTSLLTCQSSTLVDNSTNRFAVTAAGDARPVPTNPFGFTAGAKTSYTPQVYGGSTFFDGTGDQLTVPANVALQLTGDFTVEAWVYPTVINSFNMICGVENGANSDYLSIRASSLEIALSNTVYPGWTQTFVANQWYHIAVTRSSNTLRAFVNGVQLTLATGSATSSLQYFQSNVPFAIGKYATSPTAPHFFTGYISDLRIVKGTAVYTSSFVPPAAPLEPVTNTVLLLNGTGAAIYDASTLNNLETVGNAKAEQFGPYNGNYYSVYSDGNGDFLTTPSATWTTLSGTFTVEFWIKWDVAPTAGTLTGVYTNGGWSIYNDATRITPNLFGSANIFNSTFTTASVVLGRWYHIAVTRNSSNLMTMWVDGQDRGSTTTSTTYTQGTWHIFSFNNLNATQGNISNYRVNNTCLYTTAFTPATQPLTAVTGTVLLTCQSNRFIDNSPNNFAVTRGGEARVQTQNPFQNNSGQSYNFDGTGDYLVTYSPAVNQNIAFGTGNFTVEFWFYAPSNAGTQQLYDTRPTGQGSTSQYIALTYLSGSLNYYTATANPAISGGAVTAGVWNHVALSRSGTSTRLFINGTQAGSTYTDSQNYLGSVNRPILATDGNSPNTANFTGYISDLRITKGVARYTANFTPPTEPFQDK